MFALLAVSLISNLSVAINVICYSTSELDVLIVGRKADAGKVKSSWKLKMAVDAFIVETNRCVVWVSLIEDIMFASCLLH
jgi:hypothetical protein